MNIVYDLDRIHPGWDEKMPLYYQIYFDDLYEFVETRIKVLESEIDKEESINNMATTMIALTEKMIKFSYSEELNKKLVSCFTEKDMKSFVNKIETYFNALSN